MTFSEPVSARVADIRLTNLGVDAPRDADVPITLDDSQLTIDGAVLALDFARGTLPDGVYRLEILPSVTDLAGLPLDGDGDGNEGGVFAMTGDAGNRLHVLRGDFNGDLGVSIFDFLTFSYWFGHPVGIAPAYVDLNDDDGVSILDFSEFAADFGRSVVPESIPLADPARSLAAAASATRRRAASGRDSFAAEEALAKRRRTHDLALLELFDSVALRRVVLVDRFASPF